MDVHTIFINGKFSAQRLTGVQRLAFNLIQALDNLLVVLDSKHNWVLLCPPGANPPLLKVIRIRIIGRSFANLHLWEQVILPLHTRGELLLNLAGPAPLLKRYQGCMIPDAAVFDYPSAYTVIYRIWYRLLFRRIVNSALLLLTISNFSRTRLILALGPRAQHLRIVYCASTHITKVEPDFSILNRLSLRGCKFLLAVGSMNPTKNLTALTSAFSTITMADVRLVLVGGVNHAVFTGKSIEADGDPRVIFTGPINDSQLSALYRSAHAFVFPSLYEGFGIPPLEAMSLGCPVVAARSSSIPEVCGDAALYFDPLDIQDLVQALDRILTEDTLRGTLLQRGAKRVDMFTWDCAASQLLDHLIAVKLIGKP
jgi:glycosyltransferase involved in cell wall biosynthesis